MSDFLLHGVNMETLKTVSRTFRTADLRANLVQESPYRDNCEGHRLTFEDMEPTVRCMVPLVERLLLTLASPDSLWEAERSFGALQLRYNRLGIRKTGTCTRDRRALQQLALNVHVKHSDLTWSDHSQNKTKIWIVLKAIHHVHSSFDMPITQVSLIKTLNVPNKMNGSCC